MSRSRISIVHFGLLMIQFWKLCSSTVSSVHVLVLNRTLSQAEGCIKAQTAVLCNVCSCHMQLIAAIAKTIPKWFQRGGATLLKARTFPWEYREMLKPNVPKERKTATAAATNCRILWSVALEMRFWPELSEQCNCRLRPGKKEVGWRS